MMNLNGLISIAIRRSFLFVALTTLNLFAEGEPKMPTLNWMGREKATKSVKEVLLKIRREDKSMGHLSHAERPWRFAPCRRQRREDIPHLARPQQMMTFQAQSRPLRDRLRVGFLYNIARKANDE